MIVSKRDAKRFGQFKIGNLKADKTFILSHREIKTVTKLTILTAQQVDKYFGWEPKHQFKDGIIKSIEWYKLYLIDKYGRHT